MVVLRYTVLMLGYLGYLSAMSFLYSNFSAAHNGFNDRLLFRVYWYRLHLPISRVLIIIILPNFHRRKATY